MQVTIYDCYRFTINATTGRLTVNGNLDRETTNTYYVLATVTDGPGRQDFATLVINIADINDQKPM